jgi:hypothetical protein
MRRSLASLRVRSHSALLTFALVVSASDAAFAGPLTEARVNQIVNEVKLIEPTRGARAAALQDVIKGDLGVHTGVQSRAELLFQDNTLTRLGAETFFSFKPGTRDLTLDRGTMLLQVPKNLGGARIRAASVTASITGTTIMIEHLPAKSLKIVVLEGSLRVGLNTRVGETLMLTAGKMVIMSPDAKRIPEPVDVDLRKMVRTSALIDPAAFRGNSKATAAVLPSIGLIEKEIARQDGLLKKSGLVATNLVIAGSGSKVVVASDETLAALDQRAVVADVHAEPAATTPVAETKLPLPTVAQTTPDPTASVTPSDTTRLETVLAATDSATLTTSGARASVGTTVTTPPATTSPSAPPAAVVTQTQLDITAGGGTLITTGAAATTPVGTAGATATVTADNSGTTVSVGATIPDTAPAGPVNVLTPISLTLDLTLPSLNLTNATILNIGSLVGGQSLIRKGANGLLSGLLILPPAAGDTVELRGPSLDVSSRGVAGINVNGGDGILNLTQEGGSGGVLVAGTVAAPIAGKIEVDAPITATTGKNSLTSPTGGAGGAVQLVANGKVKVTSTIKVSDTAAGYKSKSGGSIAIRSASGIEVANTGQLLSLLDAAAPGAGGTIKFIATGGDIKVDGKIQADRGRVELGTAGTDNRIELTNAAISGDVVKVGALGANGELRIGGSTINADSTLKLYAGTTDGQVRFTDNVTLGGAGTKTIAGRTVRIDNGKTVTIGGSSAAGVFTDHPNYSGSGGNGATTGKFGGAGATTQPFSQTPTF